MVCMLWGRDCLLCWIRGISIDFGEEFGLGRGWDGRNGLDGLESISGSIVMDVLMTLRRMRNEKMNHSGGSNWNN